jgi:hypothetical protein
MKIEKKECEIFFNMFKRCFLWSIASKIIVFYFLRKSILISMSFVRKDKFNLSVFFSLSCKKKIKACKKSHPIYFFSS